ncbi:sterol carrier family protein [Trueperella sp. LYQ143]|uniref:sterol carrier family protein n=1 Tax=Trueperella sp. LYQ143 TaxID=3391059 RepID=UPI003983359C
MRRRIDAPAARELLAVYARTGSLDEPEKKIAARFALEEFAHRYPGRSVEIRIPWVGAVQAIAGPIHTRGTPPNVVEIDVDTWLAAVLGMTIDPKRISYSGTRADISQYLPLFTLAGEGSLVQDKE